MPRISGFTMVRNAVRLDYPLVESIRSVLPVVDEFVVNVGRSEDGTLELVRAIEDPRVRIIESEWDAKEKNFAHSTQTLAAMRACTSPWGIYIQADEVLHERGAEELRRTIEAVDADARVEGLLVNYLHFYGTLDLLATHRRWYRREVRAVRLDPALDIRPYQGAQGFRVGPEHRRIRARLTGAMMYHYGWARPAHAIQTKRDVANAFFPDKHAADRDQLLPWMPFLRAFHGEHPAVAREWVAARRGRERGVGPRHFHRKQLRLYLSGLVERLTGVRPFEFRNYRIV